MNQYKIYIAPSGSFEAVKQGWSWPAFFFNPVWALAKRLWLIGALTLPLMMFFWISMAVTENIPTEGGQIASGFLSLVWLVYKIIFGALGNSWREQNLVARDYIYMATVSASDPTAATLGMQAKSKRSPPLARNDVPAPRVERSEFRTCPFCAETIRMEAIKCKHCASHLATGIA